MRPSRASFSDAASATVRRSWTGALNDSDFWDLLARRTAAKPSVLLLVDLAGSAKGDPQIPAPDFVEALIDLIHERSDVDVKLGSSSDESHLYAANRDVFALADLIGYRFITDKGHAYEIVDLSENLRSNAFCDQSSLRESGLSEDWIDAGFRVNVASLHADDTEGFAGALRSLLNVLPAIDKQLHYRHRRDLGEVISDLLDAYPADFTLIHAKSAHSSGDKDDDEFAVASSSPVLADFFAALKAGLDPYESDLFERVAVKHPVPRAYRIDGSLEPRLVLPPVAPLRTRSTKARAKSEAGDRLVSGWLRPLDPELFPAERTLDTRAQELLRQLVGNGTSPTGNALLDALNYTVGAGGYLANAWRTLLLKDRLIQRAVSLGINPSEIEEHAFSELITEIEALRPIIDATPECLIGLRWRKLEKAVLFQYVYWTAIPFDVFVDKVDVSRTIGYMNDYLGGTVSILATDECGRPVRQAERNLYLPQPNYIVLYGGQPIDVTKIETVVYGADDHRLYWKTVLSTNGSASADDGSASFTRDGAGTRISFICKQRFVLPPLFKLFDISLVPDVERALTTDAYRQFFERTCSNLEALVEGRDIRIGRPADEHADFPSIALERFLASAAEQAASWFKSSALALSTSEPDQAGFVHVTPIQ